MSGRKDRKALADVRALEEQSERVNPVNPVHQSSRKGYTGLVLEGAGATPSMGLSQHRGGAKKSKKAKKEEEESSSEEEEMTGGAVMVGAGTKKGQTRKTARKAYEHTPSEMGKQLADEMEALHGAGFLEDFRKGFNRVASPNVSGVGFEAVSGGALEDKMYAEAKKTRKPAVSKLKGGAVSKTGAYEGKGVLTIQHGEGIVKGGAKKTRKPASATDGRRKRAEIVKKVMAEKGLSLVEASKYVKAHNLYQK